MVPPKINYTTSLIDMISKAERALGELKALMGMLPTHYRLHSKRIIQESVASSKIEGTTATLNDILMWDMGKVPKREAQLLRVQEVLNYRAILQDQWDNIETGWDLNNNTLKIMYQKLWRNVEWQRYSDEGFRVLQNWIGGGRNISDSKYVPPPPRYVPGLMNDLEEFISDHSDIPDLLRCAMAHYWFEAIHPFIDGNGRIGRLLIPLVLYEKGIMAEPLLYLSAYFDKHHEQYYDGLLAVSQKSRWLEWIKFFLMAFIEQADEAMENIQRLMTLMRRYKDALRKRSAGGNVVFLMESLFSNPYVTIPHAARFLEVTYPSAKSAVMTLVDAGILQPTDILYRSKVFVARDIEDALNA